MNIVTQALVKRLAKEFAKNSRLKEWIAHWDAMEALVIRVYKAKGAAPQDEAEYARLRPWLHKSYPRWEEAFSPYWRKAMQAGALATQDPFARLLAAREAGDFAGDWSAMQTLPAAREAINQYLLDRQT